MKIKLTELQKHRLKQAHNNQAEVLQEIKSKKTYKGEQLVDMQNLERSVQEIELFLLGK